MKIKISKDLEEIVPNFINNRTKDFVVLDKAIGENDFKTFEMIGHRLAGSAKSYGFEELGDWGRKLEYAAQDKKMEEIVGYINLMKEYMNDLEVEFV